MFNIFSRILLHSALFLILILNGGPARVARKPVVLLIPHFFQDQTGCIAPVALEPANFVVFFHCMVCSNNSICFKFIIALLLFAHDLYI